MPDGFPEYFVGLPAIEFQFMFEILPRFHFGILHRKAWGLSRLRVPREQRRVGFALTPCLRLLSFLNSIFQLLVPPGCYVFTIIRPPSRSSPHTRAANEATAAFDSYHPSSMCAVHSGSLWNNYDTPYATVFLTSLSTRAAHFMISCTLV